VSIKDTISSGLSSIKSAASAAGESASKGTERVVHDVKTATNTAVYGGIFVVSAASVGAIDRNIPWRPLGDITPSMMAMPVAFGFGVALRAYGYQRLADASMATGVGLAAGSLVHAIERKRAALMAAAPKT